MHLKSWFKKYGLFAIASVIGLLLLVNIYAMYENHLVINRNKTLQEEAERIKVNTLDIIRNLNLLDMGLRSYALVPDESFLVTVDGTRPSKEAIFANLERLLKRHHYPMHNFYVVKDSVDSYYRTVDKMREHLLNDRREKFLLILSQDPGLNTWRTWKTFTEHVNNFEDRIFLTAKTRYEYATMRSYLLQVLLFLIAMPTLLYMAYFATRSFKMSEQLREAEEENAKSLAEQNEKLEHLVRERTNEILLQNEEISAQHEEIVSHNEQLIVQQREIEAQSKTLTEQNTALQEAKRLIEEQNRIIQKKNDGLKIEVERQTNDLKRTNHELAEQNSRLEQFAYIISHNLRAPLARLVGLSNLFDRSVSPEETAKIVKMIVASTTDLDHVIEDLSNILRMHKSNTQVLSKADMRILLNKITKILKHEIEETKTRVLADLQLQEISNTLPQYIESILYNLISNAIKYRHPGRAPVITVRAVLTGQHVTLEVSDNGLGIDLQKYKDNLFSLYKRFHFHVEGKGLGLYLVKTQVTALGGTIDVHSKIDEGTTFVITLKQ